jgi:hypothetical protein
MNFFLWLMQATELSKIPTYAILCTATNYRLLLYRPAGPDGHGEPSLVSSSELFLDLNSTPSSLGNSSVYADVAGTKASLKILILKIANMFVAQMHSIDEARSANLEIFREASDPVSGVKFSC